MACTIALPWARPTSRWRGALFKHILAPIDGSGHAVKTYEMAIHLALTYDARLTLLDVARKFALPEKLRESLKAEHLSADVLYDIDKETQKIMKDIRELKSD